MKPKELDKELKLDDDLELDSLGNEEQDEEEIINPKLPEKETPKLVEQPAPTFGNYIEIIDEKDGVTIKLNSFNEPLVNMARFSIDLFSLIRANQDQSIDKNKDKGDSQDTKNYVG